MQKKKSSRRAWREKPSLSNEEVSAKDPTASNLLEYSSDKKVEKIGNQNPIQDFEAMMARRDSSKWVRKAIEEMQNYIANMLENSHEQDAFQKAVECLKALRKGCIIEQVFVAYQ